MARLGRGFPVQVRTSRAVAPPPPNTLVIADLASAATLDAPVLVQTHVLVVADLASATTLSSPAVADSAPWPDSVSASNQLIDQYGVPIRLPVFSSWAMAMRLSNSEITTNLEALKAKGFRGVNFAFCGGVATNSGLDAVQYKNVAGSNFFTGTPFTSATLGAAFSTTDWIVSECERLDMVAMLALFCSFGDSGIIEQVVAASNAQMRAFGVAVGTRYDSSPNVVWEIMGDNIWAASDTLGRRLDYFARGLDEGRTSYPNLWFCEPFPGTDATEHFLDDEGTDPTGYEWLHMDANAMYSYENNGVEIAESVRSAAVAFATRDVCWWDSEGPYAHSNAYDDGYGEHQGIRMRNASDFIEDCAIVNYGDEKWWGFDLPNAFLGNWADVPTDTTTVEASYVWAIVDQYIDGDATYTPTSWIATGEGTGAAKAASGHSDTAGVCMFPDSRTITVNTTFMPGSNNVRLRWYDPSAGTYTSIATSEAQNATRSVTHPGSNVAGGTDWLLIVDAPPTALTIADLTSASTLDAQTLTQVHVLTVAGLTSAATLDAQTLGFGLAVADLTSAGTLDAPVLGFGLTVADLTSAATLDAQALTQVHVLAVADLASATTLDNLTVNFGVSLVVADMTSAATLDALALTQVHSLVVADLTSAGALDALVLNLITTLSVADLTSASTLDGQTLTQLHQLVVSDLASGTVLDGVVLVTTAELTIADLTSAAPLESPVLQVQGTLAISDLTSAATIDNVVLETGAILIVDDLVSATDLQAQTLSTVYVLDIHDIRSFTSLPGVTLSSGAKLGKMRGEWVL